MKDVPIKFTQNFLKSPGLVQELIDKTRLDKKMPVLEIGTGLGKITKILADNFDKVYTVEKDNALAQKMRFNLKEYNNVEVVNIDFLDFKMFDFDYQVFSNIPFSITSDIVRKLFFDKKQPEKAYLFMQKEAAEKYASSKESVMGLILKLQYYINIVHNFEREDFTPVPGVDVVLIEFVKKRKIPEIDFTEFENFLTYFFSRWKKDIKHALKGIFSNMQSAIIAERNNFSLDAKPSDLSLETWLEIFYSYNKFVPYHKKRKLLGKNNTDYTPKNIRNQR